MYCNQINVVLVIKTRKFQANLDYPSHFAYMGTILRSYICNLPLSYY